METYRNQLIAPYLQDTAYLSKLVKDAYYRTKHQIKASHVLVKLSSNATPKDTLVAYQKILKARAEILSGTSFSKVAKAYSDDTSAKRNGGDLGYFTAFKMLYPFENAAFNTKVGDISMPFRTRFGYHVVKVFDLRLSKGEIEVSHILITGDPVKGKRKIDSLHASLLQGADFQKLASQFSNDTSSSSKGGNLPRFGIGRMLNEFETVAFSLSKEKNLSSPFKTKHGWHIVKLLQTYPVKPFSELKAELTKIVKAKGGARLSDLAVLSRLKKEYDIVINKKALEIFNDPAIRGVAKEKLQAVLLSINDNSI